MAETAVISLLKELSTFLLNQSSNLGGELQREVQFIRDELGSIRGFVRDAEAKEEEVSELKEWVNQVREVAYDMEDVLDEFIWRFAHHGADGFRGYVRKTYHSIKNLKARWRISSEVKNLRARVIDISERHRRYQSQYGDQGTGCSSASVVVTLDNDIRANSILIEEAELVGISAPKTELLSQILADNSQLKVIAVVGMGGLGKTTLVRKVFDDRSVKKRFQICVWLTISQTFHVLGIIKNLIQQVFDEMNESIPSRLATSMDIIWLSAFAKEFLQNRSCIFVLDDVWSEGAWDVLKCVFPAGNQDVRIILTTRIANVASTACSGAYDHIHEMKPLSDENSWTLFCNRAFRGNNCPPHLEEVSARILKKCRGMPLAIATIGGVLAVRVKNKIGEWEMILRSLGDESEDNGKLDRIKRILVLSYNDLPHYLKNCLLYVSIYPEDYKIWVSTLLHNWIAQGFIQEKHGISSYDIATSYVNELVNKSLLQVADTYADGTLFSCCVHDILRDLMVSKSSEQNFSAIAIGNYSAQRSKRLRRLVIYDCIDNPHQQPIQDDCSRSLRTLEFLGENSQISGCLVSKFLCHSTKLLKVLNLSRAPLEDIPKEVFNLFHLRSLSLQYTRVRTIPKLIGKLQNLEILDLYGTEVREIPMETFKLTKLSFLWINGLESIDGRPSHVSIYGFKSPAGIGKLLSLEYLESIDADNGIIVKEIGKLTNLKMLSITKLRSEDGKEFLYSLVKLTSL